jgi:hypothetical protein
MDTETLHKRPRRADSVKSRHEAVTDRSCKKQSEVSRRQEAITERSSENSLQLNVNKVPGNA